MPYINIESRQQQWLTDWIIQLRDNHIELPIPGLDAQQEDEINHEHQLDLCDFEADIERLSLADIETGGPGFNAIRIYSPETIRALSKEGVFHWERKFCYPRLGSFYIGTTTGGIQVHLERSLQRQVLVESLEHEGGMETFDYEREDMAELFNTDNPEHFLTVAING